MMYGIRYTIYSIRWFTYKYTEIFVLFRGIYIADITFLVHVKDLHSAAEEEEICAISYLMDNETPKKQRRRRPLQIGNYIDSLPFFCCYFVRDLVSGARTQIQKTHISDVKRAEMAQNDGPIAFSTCFSRVSSRNSKHNLTYQWPKSDCKPNAA